MKKITFAIREKFIDPITPSKTVIADWYKKAPKFPKSSDNTFVGFKSCVPFLDAMTAGYMITTPCDIKVEQTEGGPYFSWRIDWAPISARDQLSTHGIEVPAGFSPISFAWFIPYVFSSNAKTSFLITHPLNRFDLPFITTSGITDMTSVLDSGHIPFFIRSDFEGVIPKGTPFAQLVPFTREPWKLAQDQDLIEAGDKQMFLALTKFYGHYRDKVWARKTYEGI